MTRTHLTAESVNHLWRNAVSSKLDRASMLNGVDAATVGAIPTKPSPNEQLHADLHYLNDLELTPDSPDSRDPFQIWLHNASTLVWFLPEGAVFANIEVVCHEPEV